MDRFHLTFNFNKASFFFFIFVLILISIVFFALPRVTIPLLLAYVLSLFVKPVLPYLVKLGINRTLAVTSIVFGLLFAVIYPVVKVIPLIRNESQNLQYYIPKIESYARTNYDEFTTAVAEKTGYEIETNYLDKGLDWVAQSSHSAIIKLPTLVASALEWLFLVPLFLFFLIKDGRAIKMSFLKLVPNPIFERWYHLNSQFNKQFGDYMFAKFVEASILGIIITCGLLFMDVKFSILLGIVAGITNIIPYLGPFLGLIPAVVFCLVEYGMGSTLGAVLILYSIANAIDLVFVFPILVSKIIDLHPVVVIVGCLLGSHWMGVIGMVIAPPVAAISQLLLLEIYKGLNPNYAKSRF